MSLIKVILSHLIFHSKWLHVASSCQITGYILSQKICLKQIIPKKKHWRKEGKPEKESDYLIFVPEPARPWGLPPPSCEPCDSWWWRAPGWGGPPTPPGPSCRRCSESSLWSAWPSRWPGSSGWGGEADHATLSGWQAAARNPHPPPFSRHQPLHWQQPGGEKNILINLIH